MIHIYFTACSENGGIYHYTFSHGYLRFCESLTLDMPMYTLIKNRTAYILLRDMKRDDGYGGLVTCNISQTGKMTDLSYVRSTHGIVPCHLCVTDNVIYIVNYLSGNIVKIPDTVINHYGKGINPERQEAPHTHFISESPDGKFILSTDLGLDTVFVYDKDLNEVSHASVPDGSGCRHLCFGENGRYVYCVNELSSDVSVFSFKDGIISYIKSFKAIPDYSGKSTAAAIRLNNGFLYVSHRGADCISRFKTDGENLVLIENTPCGGKSPHDFDIIDNHIFCANEGGTIGIIKLTDSKPILADSFKLAGNPLCVSFYIIIAQNAINTQKTFSQPNLSAINPSPYELIALPK